MPENSEAIGRPQRTDAAHIAALGLAAGNELAKRKLGDAVLFKFQRTIGDGYVHEEAKREASRLSANIPQHR